jgi:hypothetical protein
MKKSLFLYLFIIAVLMNIFTYKYFTTKEAAQNKPVIGQDSKKLNDSITKLTDQLYDANYFSLEANDRAINYLNQDDIKVFTEKVTQALLAYNDDKAGNKYTDQVTMGEQKFIINKVKLLNHRWIIANYSNGKLWGEVLLKYFINDDQTVSFEIMNSYLYPEQLN